MSCGVVRRENQHHDQCFGDFLGAGKPQLAFWNQQAKTLFLAEIPANPRTVESWPLTEVVSGTSAGSTPYTEGMSAFDVDADGKADLLAYDTWFKHTGGKSFKPVPLAKEGGLNHGTRASKQTTADAEHTERRTRE